MLNDLQKRFFGFDNRFARTIKDLTVNPGRLVRSYIDGNRVIYIGPVGFYFLILTLYLLLGSILDIDLQEMMYGMSESIQTKDTSPGQQQLAQEFLATTTDNFRIFSFLMVPFYILSNKILYRKSGLNFLEHSVVVFYALAYPMIASTLFLLSYKSFGFSAGVWGLVITWLYYAWICTSFYAKNKLLGFFKGLLAWSIGYLFLLLIIVVVMGIFLFMHPERLESFGTSN